MATDRYTKGVLTVIAACLLWLCAMQVPGTVQAQQTAREIGPWSQHVQPVVLVGVGAMDHDGKVMLYFSPHNGVQWTDPTVPVQLPYSPDHPLPVGLPYSTSNPLPTHLALVTGSAMPVEITGVRKSGDWEPIRVAVEPTPGRGRPGGGGDR